jgi:predicted NUDIX family NTP pyrophosphohydrolase
MEDDVGLWNGDFKGAWSVGKGEVVGVEEDEEAGEDRIYG